MLFNKIRETIQAFRTHPEPRPYVSSADKALSDVDEPVENALIDILILLAVCAVSIQIAGLIHWVIKPETLTFDKYASTVIGAVSAFLIGQFHDKILKEIKRYIPDEKIRRALNPYFGSKFRETIHAFKKAK